MEKLIKAMIEEALAKELEESVDDVKKDKEAEEEIKEAMKAFMDFVESLSEEEEIKDITEVDAKEAELVLKKGTEYKVKKDSILDLAYAGRLGASLCARAEDIETSELVMKILELLMMVANALNKKAGVATIYNPVNGETFEQEFETFEGKEIMEAFSIISSIDVVEEIEKTNKSVAIKSMLNDLNIALLKETRKLKVELEEIEKFLKSKDHIMKVLNDIQK